MKITFTKLGQDTTYKFCQYQENPIRSDTKIQSVRLFIYFFKYNSSFECREFLFSLYEF